MIKSIAIKRSMHDQLTNMEDVVAIEEPLEIQLEFGASNERKLQSLSVTMRTPGNDFELAVGFLLTEGLITSYANLATPATCATGHNRILVRLHDGFDAKLDNLKRNFYTTSSCGVCGKQSIEAIHQVCNVIADTSPNTIDLKQIATLPSRLMAVQKTFVSTGGIHAAAFFDNDGNLLNFREDVGRHNALDKLIGVEIIKSKGDNLNLSQLILLLSGRASFELIQKAAMAGIKVVCAIGAPSSLAVETAEAFDITLIGFLKSQSCNVYSKADRIKKEQYHEN
ncbi:MAG: formate dehydrogenase accessory sulfurtransferase FdhD [Aquaticitalea sp.]